MVYLLLFFSYWRYKSAIFFTFLGRLKCETIITLPNSLKWIDYCAFSNSGITSVIIPKNVEMIYMGAFYNCTSLTDITILNKNCFIYDEPDAIYDGAIIHGHTGSTAEKYALKYGRVFVPIQ